MTVRQLREFLDQLPEDAQVCIETDEETFVTACREGSSFEEVCLDIPEDDLLPITTEKILVLRPCQCHSEGEVVPDTETFTTN